MTYEVLKILNQSEMGITELVQDQETKKKYVRKMIVKRKYRGIEEQVKQKLNNPGIQMLRDVKHRINFVHLIFDYVEGVDFFDFVESKSKTLPEHKSFAYFEQLVNIMNYCHQHGIVHRDLKLDNIVIGDNDRIVIIDWNFAAVWNPDKKLTLACGSPEYVAPEILNGKSYLGPEVDIYAMGVILYAITVGSFPNSVEAKSGCIKILNEKIWYPDDLDYDLQQLLAGMLNRNPSQRWKMSQIIESSWFQKYRKKMRPYVN